MEITNNAMRRDAVRCDASQHIVSGLTLEIIWCNQMIIKASFDKNSRQWLSVLRLFGG